MALTMAVANQKGGVGKTTTVYHFARAASQMGLNVLCVDNDPQGNLTRVLAPEVMEGQAGLSDALSTRSEATLDDVTASTIWDNVEIIPTTGEALGVVRDELVIAGAGRESRLREALKEVEDQYDLILIDCAPSLDQLTINGLTAADTVLITTQTKLWSVDGLAHLLKTIDSVKAHYNPALTIKGILMNQHEEKTVSGSHWKDELGDAADNLGIKVLTPPIPKRVVISDAHESAKGLDEWPSKEAHEMADLYTKHLIEIRKGE